MKKTLNEETFQKFFYTGKDRGTGRTDIDYSFCLLVLSTHS